MGSEWKPYKVDQLIIKRNQGVNTTTEKVSYSETGFKVIRANNISHKGIDWSNCVYVDEATFKRIKDPCKPQKGDILYTNIGSQFGVAVKVESDEEFIIAWNILRIQTSDKVDTDFLVYVLNNPKNRRFIQSLNASSTMPFVSGKVIGDLEFNFPDVSAQKEIKLILRPLDNKIQLNRQTNQTLEKMAQALFKSWFVDFDPVIDNALAAGNPIPPELEQRAQQRAQQQTQAGASKAPKANAEAHSAALPQHLRDLFPSEFEHTEALGWVPKGWSVKAVSDALEVNPRIKLPKGSIAKFADMKELPTSGYCVNKVIQKDYSGGAKFERGDVLLARITPCLENGKTAIVDFLGEEEVGFGSTEFIVLRGNGLIGTSYVACLARDDIFRAHCMQAMVGSSGRQRVQNACFEDYYLAIPDSPRIFKLFNSSTNPSFEKMTANQAQSMVLSKLRDTLLPKLISGELRLPVVETDTQSLIHEAIA